MRARITCDGILEIQPTSSTEAFALHAWVLTQDVLDMVPYKPFKATLAIQPYEVKSPGEAANLLARPKGE